MRIRLCASACTCLLFLTCMCDSGTPWRSGPYALIWIDLPDEVRLSYDVGDGGWVGLVEPQVFAVGANQEYVVAQQHPGGDKSITNFFIVEVRAGARADMQHGIIGPLSEQAYQERASQLRLPSFTKTLESLR